MANYKKRSKRLVEEQCREESESVLADIKAWASKLPESKDKLTTGEIGSLYMGNFPPQPGGVSVVSSADKPYPYAYAFIEDEYRQCVRRESKEKTSGIHAGGNVELAEKLEKVFKDTNEAQLASVKEFQETCDAIDEASRLGMAFAMTPEQMYALKFFTECLVRSSTIMSCAFYAMSNRAGRFGDDQREQLLYAVIQRLISEKLVEQKEDGSLSLGDLEIMLDIIRNSKEENEDGSRREDTP